MCAAAKLLFAGVYRRMRKKEVSSALYLHGRQVFSSEEGYRLTCVGDVILLPQAFLHYLCFCCGY